MSTQYVKLIGTSNWAHVFEPDVYMEAERFILNFYPRDDGEVEKIKKAGIRLNFKKDENGDEYIRPRRDVVKTINGRDVVFSPPRVSGKIDVWYRDPKDPDKELRSFDDGSEPSQRVGTPLTIYNGSEVEITIAVYDTRMGKGSRLEEVKVLNLADAPESNNKKSGDSDSTKDVEDTTKPTDNNNEVPW